MSRTTGRLPYELFIRLTDRTAGRSASSTVGTYSCDTGRPELSTPVARPILTRPLFNRPLPVTPNQNSKVVAGS